MLQNVLIILNLFLLESLLSIDNASVLAILVKDLPYKQQNKALRLGILGAFIFRGASLFIVAWLIKIFYLKILGGIYLVWLTFKYTGDKKEIKRPQRSLLKTIILVEIVDISLSCDNIFACTAITSNIYLIWIGVFMGIIAMRFVAGWFTKLMYKYPYLEVSAYWVIFLLGIRLIIEGCLKYIKPHYTIPEKFNFLFSGIVMLIFFLPIIFSKNGKEKRQEDPRI
jgi:YkoY family integral membrane protein